MTIPSPHRAFAATPVRALLRRIGGALSLLLLCGSVFAALVLIVVPFTTGSQSYTVLTSSMAPHYSPGTFIVVRPTTFSSLEVGDVVTYQLRSGEPAVVTHRITGFTTDQEGNRLLLTQGDNNDAADAEPVREVQVRGTLFYAVPYVGHVANALGRADRGVMVTVLAFVLIGAGVVTMVRGSGPRPGRAA